jgi:PPK2 family polyphosphate:nucleotide phosphotransferase
LQLEVFPTELDVSKELRKYARHVLKRHKKELSDQQERLYAYNKYSLLIIFQAMDAAGKDGTIKHVMSGVNPQGCSVRSFKKPSVEELDHTYLWRCIKAMPERGQIGIFNRSYYEEVLVVKVHPEMLLNQKIPGIEQESDISGDFWMKRYAEINNLEKYFDNNGVKVLKFFLNLSKKEQKNRFMKRIDDPSKNWKISVGDFQERRYWDNYQEAYAQMLTNTSTDHAPWYVIPADNKDIMRALVSLIITRKLRSLDLKFPEVDEERLRDIEKAREWLVKKDN